jgi:hypothetical protein
MLKFIKGNHQMKKALVVLLAVTLLGSFTFAAPANTSNTQTVALKAVIPEYLALDVPSVSVVNFTMVYPYSAMVPGDNPVSFNTNYNLLPGKKVTVCAYLSGALLGTGANTDTITPGNVLAKFNGAGNFAAFDSNTACGMSSGLVVNTYPVTSTLHNMVQLTAVRLKVEQNQLVAGIV